MTGLTKTASNEQEELTKEISALQREKSALHPTVSVNNTLLNILCMCSDDEGKRYETTATV